MGISGILAKLAHMEVLYFTSEIIGDVRKALLPGNHSPRHSSTPIDSLVDVHLLGTKDK